MGGGGSGRFRVQYIIIERMGFGVWRFGLQLSATTSSAASCPLSSSSLPAYAT